MRLENLLKNFPHISLANQEENTEILDYFSRFSLKNREKSVAYHREPDFFALIKARGSSSLTFTLRDDQRKLQGVACVSYRQGLINGKLETVGYLGDLRVSLNRKLIREWRNCFKEFLALSPQLEETKGCRFYQTALMETNADSRANLAANKIPGVHYFNYAPYDMVNIIGLMPSFRSPRHFYKQYHLRKAQASDHEALVEFLTLHEKEKPFGHDWKTQLPHRLENWPNFSYENVSLLEDQKGKIKACLSYYDPHALKKMSLPHIPTVIKFLKPISSLIPGMVQCPVPNRDENLNVAYVEDILGEGPKLKEHLLKEFVKENYKKFNMFALTGWKNHFDLQLSGFLSHRTPMGIFTVAPSEELQPQLKNTPPRFDMAMV